MWALSIAGRRECGASHPAGGFALVEALVATLIVSIGLLGAMQLILKSLRDCADALSRTQAITLVGDIAERIRANPAAREAYDIASYGDNPEERGCAAAQVVTARACSARELAEDDLARWRTHAFAVLPGADDARVTFTSPANSRLAGFLIEVSWLGRGDSVPSILRAELHLAGGTPA